MWVFVWVCLSEGVGVCLSEWCGCVRVRVFVCMLNCF